jgi:S-formylglutathione hydrolase FrmB
MGLSISLLLGPAVSPAVSQPALASTPASTPACPRLVSQSVPLPSSVHITDNRVNVILPVGYCSSGLRYPVLYLLHGAGDTYQSWVTRTDAVNASAGYPLIIVMPDGGHNATAGWYTDWMDGTYQWETYHVGVLPRFINSRFRTRADDLGIAGLSMGGFGALSYAARHPGMFKAAASFSGAVDTRYAEPLSGVAFTLLQGIYGTPNDRVWGNQVANEANWRAHNPTDLAGRLAGTQLFVATGTGTPGGSQGDNLADPAGYLVENVVWQMNLSLHLALNAAHVPGVTDFYSGGYHGWPYWQADLHWALPQLAGVLGGPVA